MKTTFLGQGYEAASVNAVGNYLISYLNDNSFHSFIGISAFASEAGVYGLAQHIEYAKQSFRNLSLIVGIDQEGTSKEALEEILNLDIKSYIFYQTESPIFHPKIYLFEGDNFVKLIVGSSNLTGRGLFTNVENSLLIEFNINDAEGTTLLSELKIYYKSFFDFSDTNLFEITDSTIADFVLKGIVPTEITRKALYRKKDTLINTSIVSSSAPNLTIPKRSTAKIPSSFLSKNKSNSTSVNLTQANTPAQNLPTTPLMTNPVFVLPIIKTLVWQKMSLSQSDAQQVPSGTAITANIKLSQARFKVNNNFIEQTTYFRNQVFQFLVWAKTKPTSTTYEETLCQFDITMLGNPIGIHTLKLSHDPIRVAGQGNTPTWLHWGNTILPLLIQTNVTGKIFNLYELNQNFFIEIV